MTAPQKLTAPLLAYRNIYICPKDKLTPTFLSQHNINVIINLTGFDMDAVPCADIINLSLNNDELLDDEIVRVREKIANIVSKLHAYMQRGANPVIVCNNGFNKSPVVVGYYMRQQGMSACDVLDHIHKLSMGVGCNILTNQSFKKILHERKKLTDSCACWTSRAYDYRPQANIDY